MDHDALLYAIKNIVEGEVDDCERRLSDRHDELEVRMSRIDTLLHNIHHLICAVAGGHDIEVTWEDKAPVSVIINLAK